MSQRRIFLSSTYSDLAPYREAVEKMVQEFGEFFVGMEHFGARSQAPLKTCLEEVDKSEAVLVLAGGRYGTLTEAGTSFTQQEVERARANNIPVLVFVQDSPTSGSQTEMQRQKAFVRWLQTRYTCARFQDATSLVTGIAAALRRLERPPDLSSPSEAWREILDRAKAAADWDCISLTAHNVDHLYAVDRVAADYETNIGRPVIAPGGSGANTVAGLGRMGLRVAAAGAVGRDEDGLKLGAALADDHVQALLVPSKKHSCPTGRTITFCDLAGRRSIYVEPGANAQFAAAAKSKSYLSDLRGAVASSRIIHYSSFTHSQERRLQEGLINHLSQQAILSVTPGLSIANLALIDLRPFLEGQTSSFSTSNNLMSSCLKDEGTARKS